MSNAATSYDLTIFHFPTACSTVTLVALEEIGVVYKDVLVNLYENEQYGSYRDLNPRGKVPALLVDGSLLAENAAILIWLHRTNPSAALLPQSSSEFESAKQYSDLMWAASTWHPIVRSIRMPSRLTDGEEEPVRARGMKLIEPLISDLESRFSAQSFYYGDDWSICDVYLHWCYTSAELGGVDLSNCPSINRHRAEIEARPSFVAARAREAQAMSKS